MKKTALYLVLLLAACGQFTLDENIAKQKVGELLELIRTHQYEKTKDYYSDALNESEPVEARKKKFEEIEAVSGPVVSMELIGSSKQQLDERSIIVVKYNVKCQNTTLIESFVVALDEGKYKVEKHDITNK
ncbi:MAG TPA: hypothetical protein VGO45_09735 [Bacteroidia bacterium]|jgi:hypothetical protein|nr:hypothetical protein [Bacteroidia bacterium]